MYGKGRYAVTGIHAYTKPRVALSGTRADGVTEAEVAAGGANTVLTITLQQGKVVPAGTVFDAARQAVIDGQDSAQAEAAGWDAVVKVEEVVGAVVRTSDSVVTVTGSDFDGAPLTAYSVTANETVTVTVPAALMEGQLEPVVAGTFLVTAA